MPVELTGGEPVAAATRKMMTLVHGLPGVGKTGLCLSGPSPFWFYNLDRSIDHFVPQLPATHKLVYEAPVLDVDATTPQAASTYLTKFSALVRLATASGTDGTLVFDGWDIFWDLVKIALVHNLGDDTLAKEYGPANEYMDNQLRKLGLSKLNVFFTTGSKKVWTGMKTETDRMQPEGFKYNARWLTHEVYMFSPENMSEPDFKPKQAATPGQSHMAYISKSKLNEKLVGRVIPNLTFGTLYALTFGAKYPEPKRLWSPAKAVEAGA